MANKQSFVASLRRKDVVTPAWAIQEHRLPLSNLDLLQSRICPSTYFCYKKPLDDQKFTFHHVVSLLKQSLAKTLVTYYPLAGEMTQNAAGEAEVLCNSRGVDFFEAYANVVLPEIDFYHSDQSVGAGKLVPILGPQAILAVQVTELKCGGVVLGGTVDHRLADAYSAYVFFAAWAEAARGKPFSHEPVFCRSLLKPRQPGRYDSSIEEQYVLAKAAAQERSQRITPPSEFSKISRTYYVESEKINELQSLAIEGTKLEAFSAFMWKLIASSVDKTGDEEIKHGSSRLGILADGRSRIGKNGDKEKARLMSGYFGNVNTIPFGETGRAELMEEPLSWVANRVRDFLEVAKHEEFYLGLIDWLEDHRPDPAMPRVCASDLRVDGPALLISSSLRFPVSGLDFGWGPSPFSSYYFPPGGELGCVVLLPSPLRNGDWILYIHMLKEQMDFIEAQASRIIHPITPIYLNLA